jgi:hypothetical protein
MAYASDNGAVIMFGGLYGPMSGTLLADTWTYDLKNNSWKNNTAVQSPSPRAFHSMTYDSKNNLVVLFGGYNHESCLNDTWLYDPAKNLWTNANPPQSPPARMEYSMVFDKVNGVVVMFGGSNYTDSLGDIWVYDASLNIWERKITSPGPSARFDHRMVYDSSLGMIILFGGIDSGSEKGDTWLYNVTLNRWFEKRPSSPPLPRWGHCMCFDIRNNIVVLFGGAPSQYTYPPETWIYNISGNPFRFGTYTSKPVNTGPKAYFGSIIWNATVPSGTALSFQTRSSASLQDLILFNFTGKDGTCDTFYDTSGQRISESQNGSEWIQYKAYLYSSITDQTPTLRSVVIEYNILQSLVLLSPVDGENWTGLQNISWSANDKDNDTLSFDIFLENDSAIVPLANDLPNERRQWSWNTSATPNGTYRIRVTARDDNPSIPLAVNATSGNFTIHHPIPPPPPNQPPRVILISPPNNSVQSSRSVHLTWQGIDPDDVFLTYTLRVSDRPFSQGINLTNVTTDHYFDLKNLFNNITYYWSVDASDGKSNASDVSIDVWSFTIRIFPENNPVRITSNPNTTAWVGKEYSYNLTSMDADGDIPIYSIVSSPTNITLDPSTGRLRWTPTTSDIGNQTIIIQVADGRGSTDRQIFTITVLDIPPPIAPKCAITYPANGTTVKGTIHIQGTALNGTLPLSAVKLRIDGGEWTTAIGLDNWTFPINTAKLAKGQHYIEAKAFASNLSSEPTSVDFTVSNPEPGVSSGGNPWCLPVVIVAVVAGLSVLILLRKNRGKSK